MKSIKTGNVMAAEYIGLGANKKHNLINVYTGDILVQSLPAKLPFAFYIEIFPEEGMGNTLHLKVIQNKKVKGQAEASFEFEPNKIALIVLPAVQFDIPKETEIKIVASAEGYGPTTILKKKIMVGEIPT